MYQKISEKVDVEMRFGKKIELVSVHWGNRAYKVDRIGLHHTVSQGRTLFHVFSVVTDTLFMRLILNSQTLTWRLEEVAHAV